MAIHAAGMVAGIVAGFTRASGASPLSLPSMSPVPHITFWCPISMFEVGGPTAWFSSEDQLGNSTGPPRKLNTGPARMFQNWLLNMYAPIMVGTWIGVTPRVSWTEGGAISP